MAIGSFHCVQCARSLPSRCVVGFTPREGSVRGTFTDPLQGAFLRNDFKDRERQFKKKIWRVRASAERQEDSSPSLSELKLSLKEVLVREDYRQAAVLRDKINELIGKDPVLQLKARLKEAIKEENYLLAAKLRDELKSLEPPPPVISVRTTSSAETENIKVDAESQYVGKKVISGEEYFNFHYTIVITNNGPEKVRLKTRHWEIVDANGNKEIVNGEGVVGQFPELEPKQSYTYKSSCPLRTPSGTMQGYYTFARLDPLLGHYESRGFPVKIEEFGLDATELDRRL
eukprot:jgi/Botrbrau1/11951/Bobra.341_1s0016.1